MSTDPTTRDVEAVPEDEVAAVITSIMQANHPELAAVDPAALTAALAEVLPVYGALVEVRTFGHDYARRERTADALTTRAYTVGRMRRMAYEAEQAAQAGTNPAENRTFARMLREHADREGRA